MANQQPNDAHLRINHNITEAIMLRDFSKRQRKILDLILRCSWGCGNKETATIPRQKDFECAGIHEVHIKTELQWLVNSKVITRDGDKYSFVKDFNQWQVSRNKPYQPERLTELVSINLQELTKTVSENLPKHKESTYQNSKNPTPKLASPKENIKESIKETIYMLPEFINKETWEAFLEMRKQIKKTPTERAKYLLIKDLENFRAAGDNPNSILEQSIKNNWTGLFPLKKEQIGGKLDVQPKYIIE